MRRLRIRFDLGADRTLMVESSDHGVSPRRTLQAGTHRFSAKVTQDAVAGRHLELIAKKVTDGSLAPFITHLVQAKKLTKKDKDAIRRLLED